MIDRRDALLEGTKAGKFLEAVYKTWFLDRGDGDEVALEVAALHNEGLVDVVAAFENLKRESAGGRAQVSRAAGSSTMCMPSRWRSHSALSRCSSFVASYRFNRI